MSVEYVEVLVEEPSMEAALRILLPKIVGTLPHDVLPFQCKDEMLVRLPQRLLGYANRMRSDAWFRDHVRVVVVVDRDDDECVALKRHLDGMAANAGLAVRSPSAGSCWTVVNRLAIEELEAWYFGDWSAVQAAYPKVPGTIPSRAGYRDSDAVAGGTWEAFERELQRAGYFKGGLRKIEAARMVAAQMDPQRNTSGSFCRLRDVLVELVRA